MKKFRTSELGGPLKSQINAGGIYKFYTGLFGTIVWEQLKMSPHK